MNNNQVGRPRKYHTEQEREAARLAQIEQATERQAEKRRLIKDLVANGLDMELLDALNAAAEGLEAKLGFRPTPAQTIRHLLKAYKESN